jgi:hypothetical protein
MNLRKGLSFGTTLAMIAASAAVLNYFRAHQQLGAPGVKWRPLTNSVCVQVELPERVLDYDSQWVEVDNLTRQTLPQDTSYGARLYKGPDGFQMLMNVVLMGADRTSLHKPQICLEGQGFHIDTPASEETRIRIERPASAGGSYDLPVVKLVGTRQVVADGRTETWRGVYVYWFVADDALSASVSGFERMWWMARHLVSTGVLQRWAYVSCLAYCRPGQEQAAFDRMKALIQSAAPQFQLAPRAATQP